MDSSVLNDIKKLLGLEPDYTCYDIDIIMFINSALAEVAQLGYGPNTGVRIESASETWEQILPDTTTQIELVKEFVYLKTRIIFDPPQSGTVLSSYNERIKELAWRLNVSPSVVAPIQEG